MQLQHEDLGGMFGGMQQPSFDDADLDEDTRESLRLAWQLQEEERTRVAEQRAAEILGAAAGGDSGHEAGSSDCFHDIIHVFSQPRRPHFSQLDILFIVFSLVFA